MACYRFSPTERLQATLVQWQFSCLICDERKGQFSHASHYYVLHYFSDLSAQEYSGVSPLEQKAGEILVIGGEKDKMGFMGYIKRLFVTETRWTRIRLASSLRSVAGNFPCLWCLYTYLPGVMLLLRREGLVAADSTSVWPILDTVLRGRKLC